MKVIKLAGPFTDDDLAAFVALLRSIDERNPTGVYAITVTDPEKGLDEAERFVTSLLPPLPERTTALARASYRDDSYSPRLCDNPDCERLYRGPAVYCSLECAVADA